ncbi:MAG: SelB C-terminal domain-containing protein [Acidimicrobiia bacterium]|nr:SelB C-terminal domain-containing protein [Acidimicrobiia bacterium]
MAFVDVPGHVRFIKNMLAGVGAVDACLFVVAATEGWKPQSEEHLRIVELLGVGHGLIALTKVGLVDDDTRQLAALEVSERVAGTFLENARIVGVDALAGIGVDELRAALDDLLAETPTAIDRGRPRLWVDRVFAAKGSGTVVTGTLTGGSISVGDELVLLPGHRQVRVRGLQTHQQTREHAEPGSRVAANLSGVHHDQVRRGDALVRPGQWEPTTVFDASVEVLAGLDHAVSRRGAFHVYIGSGEQPARLRLLGSGPVEVEPGGTGFVRVHLPSAVPLLPGDRFVLRESGRAETVGGGEVLDVAPVLSARRASPSRSAERVVAERGWVDVDLLERLTGERVEPELGRWVVADAALGATVEELERAVADAGALGLDVAALDERKRAALERLEGVVVEGGRVRGSSTDDPLAGHPFVARLEASPFSPPEPDDVDRAELRELVRRGLIVERDGYYFAPAAVEEAGRRVAALLSSAPEGVTVSQVRDALGTTRKHALPMLAHLDATGVTRRRGDVRVGGPRLPQTT